MQQFYAAVGTGDKDTAASLMADDVRWMEAENFPLADRNPYVGAQAVLEGVFARLGDVLDDFGVEPGRFIADETTFGDCLKMLTSCDHELKYDGGAISISTFLRLV